MTRWRSLLNFLASLALHGLIAAILFGREPRPALPVSDSIFEIELRDLPIVAVGGPVSASPQKQKPKNRKSLTLNNLLPKFRPTGLEDSANRDARSIEDSNSDQPAIDDSRVYGLGVGSFDFGAANHGFLEAIWRKIDANLIFDSLLAQYAHFGNVFVEFLVFADGRIDETSVFSRGRDRILRVHAIRALRSGLREPLAANLRIKEAVRLRAQFQFILNGSSLFDENPARISGRAMTFRRFTNQRPLVHGAGEIFKSGGMGHFEGGVNTDLAAMYDALNKFLKMKEHQRLGHDPFAIYKADPIYGR